MLCCHLYAVCCMLYLDWHHPAPIVTWYRRAPIFAAPRGACPARRRQAPDIRAPLPLMAPTATFATWRLSVRPRPAPAGAAPARCQWVQSRRHIKQQRPAWPHMAAGSGGRRRQRRGRPVAVALLWWCWRPRVLCGSGGLQLLSVVGKCREFSGRNRGGPPCSTSRAAASGSRGEQRCRVVRALVFLLLFPTAATALGIEMTSKASGVVLQKDCHCCEVSTRGTATACSPACPPAAFGPPPARRPYLPASACCVIAFYHTAYHFRTHCLYSVKAPRSHTSIAAPSYPSSGSATACPLWQLRATASVNSM